MHPKTIWLFGLPCSGKTTIAKQLIKGVKSIHLDGDIVRATLCSDLGFSPEDRMINIRRIAQVCQILNEQGITCTCSFVTPLESHREALRGIIDNLQLVYVNCPLDDCIERDVKGMYKKAKTGEIPNFTGISAPFEAPKDYDKVVFTDNMTVDECCITITKR